ncbi:uncharacterized protein LOC133310048 [Gastrolobium bilobum]|uniref:uncharacterized protein LOC133310048 n=1 Tax=Gastrolobium bilobum TaxID=150636 RepID=UPI002AAF2842|nr:uncharacterized protein LOC133310048 [Gastrolobium bilobum]
MHGASLTPVFVKENLIRNFAKDVEKAANKCINLASDRRIIVADISWQFPNSGAVKVNTDRVACGNPSPAACGGVIYDECAWNAGYRNIIIENDSTSVPTVLTRNGAAVRENHLISHIQTWIDKIWSVTFRHTLRESNSCVDWLANFILDYEGQENYLIWHEPPTSIQFLLLADLSAVGRPRALSCNN